MTILLNPGPVTLSERVRNALLRPDLCHREAEFSELQKSIRSGLLDIYSLNDTDWASVLLTGSGTAAVEAMITSCVPAHGKLLCMENGVYGERMTRIAEAYNIDHRVLQHGWGDELDLTQLEGELRHHEEITHVAVVHHETTTGLLNDLDAIARICKKYDVALLIDAVSSFGAEAIKFSDWNVAATAATANKCLHGVPGTSFVVVEREALQRMQATEARSVYLNLSAYLQSQDNGGTPFTQSVQTFYALDEAIREFAEAGGWQARNQLYRRRMKLVREGLGETGILPLLPEERTSCVLHAFYLPDNISYSQLHDHLKENGFIIYAGQGQLSKNIFRISCMGEIRHSDLETLVAVTRKLLHD